MESKLKFKIPICVICLMLASCVSTKPTVLTNTKTDSTSTSYKKTQRDSTLNVKLDVEKNSNSVVLEDSLKHGNETASKGVLNSKKSILKTKYATSEAWVENGILKHTIENSKEDIPIRIPNAVTEIEKESNRHTDSKIEKPAYVNVLSWDQKLFIQLGKASILLIAIIVAISFWLFKRKL